MYVANDKESGRADGNDTFKKEFLSEENRRRVTGLAAIARKRRQTLAQMRSISSQRTAASISGGRSRCC